MRNYKVFERMRSNMKKKIEHRTLGVGLGREVNTVVIFKYN